MADTRKTTVALAVALAIGAGLGLTACPEKEGPGEKAGKAVDEAVHDTKRAVEDATD